MKRRLPSLVLLAAAAAALAGCAGPPAPTTLPTMTARHEWRTADGRLQVAATLDNAAAGPARAAVLCQFTGAGGTALGAAQSQIIALAAGETGTVHFAAPAGAADASLSVRPAAAAP